MFQPAFSVTDESVSPQPVDHVQDAEQSCFWYQRQLWELEETRAQINTNIRRLRGQLESKLRVLASVRGRR